MNQLFRISLLGLLLVVLAAFSAWAGCSGLIGRAVINEASHDSSDYVEIKLLDGAITSSVYNGWNIRVCSDDGGCSSYAVSSAAVTLPYLVVPVADFKELDFKKGMDVILTDGSGDSIDYLEAKNYSVQQDACSYDFDTDMASTNNKTISRFPDGTGDWAGSGPGGSGPATIGETNDDALGPDGNPVARIDIDNISVNKGDIATFILSVFDENGNPATKPYAIQLEYQTIDDTAVAGTDYAAISGTVTIPANSGSATIDVVTLGSGGGCGGGGSARDFWIRIKNLDGATYPVVVLNHFALATITAGGSLDHLRIVHSGSGLTCQRSDVTLRACSDAACSSESACPVTLTMAPASAYWLPDDSGSFSFTGNTTVQLRQTVPATVPLAIASSSPSATGGVRCFEAGVEGDCGLEFFDSGFIVAVPNLTSCQAANASIQAVRTDDVSKVCIADGGFASVAKEINFWGSYSNPGSGDQVLRVNGTNIASANPGTAISLNFGSAATATFTVGYPDAGQMLLNARYQGTAGEETGLVMQGNGSFVVAPPQLVIVGNDAGTILDNATAVGAPTSKAGETINLELSATCADGTVTENYSWDTGWQWTGFAPATGVAGDLTLSGVSQTMGVTTNSVAAASYTDGVATVTDIKYSEVGTLVFTAAASNYLGSGVNISTTSSVGRFTPAYVFVEDPTPLLADGCISGGYTYLGSQFDFLLEPNLKVTARNVDGGTTSNYGNAYWKLSATRSYSDSSAGGVTLAAPPLAAMTLSGHDNYDGKGELDSSGDQFNYNLPSIPISPVAPFATSIDLQVNLVETDGICFILESDGPTATETCAPVQFPALGGSQQRFGRLVIQNAFGAETLPLGLTLNTEYFNGASFVVNTEDDCTDYQLADLTINDGEVDSLDAVETSASDSDLLNSKFASGVGTDFQLAAPSSGDSGSVGLVYDLDSAALPWLKPLDGAGAPQNPTAKATFGIYKGNERLIYMRESIR